MKIKNFDIGAILHFLQKYSAIPIWLITLGLLGFTLWQADKVATPQTDHDRLKERRGEIREETAALDIDEELKTRIERLQPTPVDTSPEALSTRDPFNP